MQIDWLFLILIGLSKIDSVVLFLFDDYKILLEARVNLIPKFRPKNWKKKIILNGKHIR